MLSSLSPPSWNSHTTFPKTAGDYTSRLAIAEVFVAREAVNLRESTVLGCRWASRSLCMQLQTFFFRARCFNAMDSSDQKPPIMNTVRTHLVYSEKKFIITQCEVC